jgi:hypothetical protein
VRKRLIPAGQHDATQPGEGWLDLEHVADVEISSEDADHPIEGALVPGRGSGWRASGPGEQTIRLVFTTPQRLSRIVLEFVEPTAERTQEFELRWSPDGGESFREIVRQQWNFAPQGGDRETEDYRVDLSAVTVLELRIVPDVSGGDTHASLERMRLG